MEIQNLLKLMAHKRASDLFITAGMPPSLKIDGHILPAHDGTLAPEQVRTMVQSLMTDAQRAQFEQTHECNYALGVSGLGRFRVSAFIQRGFPGMVLRRIESRIPTAQDLNMPSIVNDLAILQRGLVLLVGATGTGKSSTLASMVGHRNHHGTGHIITIEDPIEFIHHHERCIITQREVGLDTESYETALKNTLRQAPDVILIGEVRTRETMDHAIAFAETGHLCLTTLHANNAYQALDRIINFFPQDRRDQILMDLSLNLRAIVAQQLVPIENGQGRRVATEVLINTPLMSDIIRKGEIHKLREQMKQGAQHGMCTFDQSLYTLFAQGIISYDNAIRYADSANEVRLLVKLGHGDLRRMGQAIENLSLIETR